MEDAFLSIVYSFYSDISSYDVSDCITTHKGVLYAEEYTDNSSNEYVGEIDFKIINLGRAEVEGFDIYELFDTYEYIFRHGENFYDLSKNTFKKPIINEFPDLELGYNKLCIIETIGIIPKFRGRGIGARVFKDLVWNFDDCSLFILQPFPLQFGNTYNTGVLFQKLELDLFEKNEKKATASLSKYYQSWGFKKIKGVKDLMFYCSLYQNETFDNIDKQNF